MRYIENREVCRKTSILVIHRKRKNLFRPCYFDQSFSNFNRRWASLYPIDDSTNTFWSDFIFTVFWVKNHKIRLFLLYSIVFLKSAYLDFLNHALWSAKSFRRRNFSIMLFPIDYILRWNQSFWVKAPDAPFFWHLKMPNFMKWRHFRGSVQLINYSNFRFFSVEWLKTCLSYPK